MCIDSLPSDRVQRASHRSEPEAGSDSLFDKSMVLLQDIVHIRGRPAAATAVLQIANCEGGAEVNPARTSYGDAVNLVDEPDLPDNIALG